MYKLHSLSRQALRRLVAEQKELLMGSDNYQHFAYHFPLEIRFSHALNAQALKPGQGCMCYVHRPVIGEPLMVEILELLPPELSALQADEHSLLTSLTTAVYDLNDPMTIDYSDLDAFVILVGLEGACDLTDNHGLALPFYEGEAILIPAATKSVRLEGTIKFLEIYV
jgi:hypothetical protein